MTGLGPERRQFGQEMLGCWDLNGAWRDWQGAAVSSPEGWQGNEVLQGNSCHELTPWVCRSLCRTDVYFRVGLTAASLSLSCSRVSPMQPCRVPP